jgi:hypothetical protein
MTISIKIKNVPLSMKTLSFMPLIADCHRYDCRYADGRYADCRGAIQLGLVSSISKYQLKKTSDVNVIKLFFFTDAAFKIS